MKRILLAIVILAGIHAQAQQIESQCQGYDSQGQSWIYGDCNNGFFRGYDPKSGTFLTGSCQEHGTFSAYNPYTHSFVFGNCF